MSVVSEELSLKGVIKELLSYKSAILGLIILAGLIILSIYAVLFTPFAQSGALWNDQQVWLKYPRTAAPEWTNLFSGKKLPENIYVNMSKPVNVSKEGTRIKRTYISKFSFSYDDTPSEIIFFFNTSYEKLRPKVSILWIKPDGENLSLGTYKIRKGGTSIYLSNNLRLVSDLQEKIEEELGKKINKSLTLEDILFRNFKTGGILKGTYTVRLDVLVKNETDKVEWQGIVYGKVYGLAGTDDKRRPLHLGLLWGAPIALAFGLVASLSITFIQLIISAISGYYGGKVDAVIQRLTEIYMILPFLPMLVLVQLLYGMNLWRLLLLLIILSIFGTSVKTYRVWVMQLKSYPYVEAARAYGASNMRIIFLYILPRLIPPTIPSLVLAVPGYVFLEAALAFLGLSDVNIVTWGRIVEEAFSEGALYKGYYHWVLMPSLMLVITAISFALIGIALDRIVNPKLKEM
ncbi:MAG: ABC transporter permease [Candidatus Korarchaeota archaeon]|nr:ABC transporter permease [Candidatus Korarchaeota archaeon]